MALTNYGDLKESVADWLNRDDIDNVLPDFVKLAEDRMRSDHRMRNHLTEVLSANSGTFTGTQQVNPIDLSGSVEVSSVWINDELAYQVPDSLWKEGSLNQWKMVGTDLYLSDFTGADAAKEDMDVQIWTYVLPTITGSDVDTNTVLSSAPGVYLYATLVEASIYLRDMEGVQIYQPRYDELVDKLYKEFKRSKVSGGMAVTSVGGDR